MDQFLDQFKQKRLSPSQRIAPLDRAEKILVGIRDKDPQSFRAGYLLGEVRYLQNQYSEALLEFGLF
ncbi:MAG: hypothetical protein U0V70_10230 [Terriglobia bacterium]